MIPGKKITYEEFKAILNDYNGPDIPDMEQYEFEDSYWDRLEAEERTDLDKTLNGYLTEIREEVDAELDPIYERTFAKLEKARRSFIRRRIAKYSSLGLLLLTFGFGIVNFQWLNGPGFIEGGGCDGPGSEWGCQGYSFGETRFHSFEALGTVTRYSNGEFELGENSSIIFRSKDGLASLNEVFVDNHEIVDGYQITPIGTTFRLSRYGSSVGLIVLEGAVKLNREIIVREGEVALSLRSKKPQIQMVGGFDASGSAIFRPFPKPVVANVPSGAEKPKLGPKKQKGWRIYYKNGKQEVVISLQLGETDHLIRKLSDSSMLYTISKDEIQKIEEIYIEK